MTKTQKWIGLFSLAALTSASGYAADKTTTGTDKVNSLFKTHPENRESGGSSSNENKENKKDEKGASKQVTESAQILQKMKSEKQLNGVLQQARGIFIVPHYGRVALGVGGRGGEGILLVKQGEQWRDPAFYNFGGLSVGLQAGVEGGPIAFVLNNDKALQGFMKGQNFSLNGDAGLTIVDWSAKGQSELGRADVVAWSDTKGLFGSVAINVKDIVFDKDDTRAFYGRNVSLNEILSGQAQAPEQKISTLHQALPQKTLSGGSQ